MEQLPEKECSDDGRARRPRPPLKIQVDGEGGAMLPIAVNGISELAIPTAAAMSVLLSQVEEINDMTSLRRAAAAWQATTEQMERAIEEIAAIAEFRIRLERKIGKHLMQHVKHGGDRSRLHNVVLPPEDGLPEGMSTRMATWYRKVARVPEEQFDAYLAQQKEKGKAPSSNGAINFAASKARKVAKPAKRKKPLTSAPQADLIAVIDPAGDQNLTHVWQVVKAAMDVSVAVGVAAGLVGASTEMEEGDVLLQKLSGNVVVRPAIRIDEWLTKLYRLRKKCQLSQAMVVFHATTGESWFHLLDEHGWTCCFVRGPAPTIVAYLGRQHRAVGLVLEKLGTVMRGIGAEDSE